MAHSAVQIRTIDEAQDALRKQRLSNAGVEPTSMYYRTLQVMQALAERPALFTPPAASSGEFMGAEQLLQQLLDPKAEAKQRAVEVATDAIERASMAQLAHEALVSVHAASINVPLDLQRLQHEREQMLQLATGAGLDARVAELKQAVELRQQPDGHGVTTLRFANGTLSVQDWRQTLAMSHKSLHTLVLGSDFALRTTEAERLRSGDAAPEHPLHQISMCGNLRMLSIMDAQMVGIRSPLTLQLIYRGCSQLAVVNLAGLLHESHAAVRSLPRTVHTLRLFLPTLSFAPDGTIKTTAAVVDESPPLLLTGARGNTEASVLHNIARVRSREFENDLIFALIKSREAKGATPALVIELDGGGQWQLGHQFLSALVESPTLVRQLRSFRLRGNRLPWSGTQWRQLTEAQPTQLQTLTVENIASQPTTDETVALFEAAPRLIQFHTGQQARELDHAIATRFLSQPQRLTVQELEQFQRIVLARKTQEDIGRFVDVSFTTPAAWRLTYRAPVFPAAIAAPVAAIKAEEAPSGPLESKESSEACACRS